MTLTDTIPVPYDFIATTDTAQKKAIIEEVVKGRKNVAEVIVRIVEQNRGRDMAALFISCRDLFLDDTYQLVCRLHTKKSPQVAAGRGNLFKRHMFENLLNSPGFTANVLDMFHDNPWIGVAVPPVVHISYWTLGHAWYCNRAKAEEIKKLLGLKVPFDEDTPIGAFGTMFWFRPKALRKLFAYQWKWSEFNAEPHHIDGGLAHALERVICYVAQDANYTTQQILSSHCAGWNYGVLEYKLQKLASALPNSEFSYQCKILDDWKRAGYPVSVNGSAGVEVRDIRAEELRLKYFDRIRSVSWQITSPFRLAQQVFLGHSKQPPFWDWSAAEFEDKLASLEQSRSWRWTASLRFVDHVLMAIVPASWK